MEQGKADKALPLLCKAALLNTKLEMMVNLLSDIAEICLENRNPKEARAHLYLEKFIRTDNEWAISSSFVITLDRLDSEILDENMPLSKQDALSICRSFWRQTCGYNAAENSLKKRGLVGKLCIKKDKPICFVNTKEGLSAICFSNEISNELSNGDTVIFDILPSFDKKKNRESWKAINIKSAGRKNNLFQKNGKVKKQPTS